MSDRIKLVQGDTAPQIRLTLTNQLTGDPISLIDATVTLHVRETGFDEVLFSRPATINPETASTGVCLIAWEPGDLDILPSDYEGEIEVVAASGARETIYDMLKFRVRGDIA